MAVILFGVRLEATTYTVKASGGGNYTTIQACASVAKAGDTCTVYAGTYSETPAPANSGTAGSPITFAVNPGDCVTVSGFSLGSRSYITLGTPAASSCSNAGLTYSGFEFTGSVTWTQISHVIMQNNYAHSSSAQCFRGPTSNSSGSSSYDSLLNNIVQYCGGTGASLTSGATIEGDHWLIDGNQISHVQSAMQLYCGYCVVRNNNFGPLAVSDYATQHTQPLESSCSGDFPLQHMLYENNVTHDWRGPNAHLFLMRDVNQCGMTGNITRLSVGYNIGADWTANDSYSLKTYSYNNSDSQMELDSGKAYSSYTFQSSDTGNVVKNFIQQDSWNTGGSDYCLYADSTSTSGFVEGGNICYLSTGSVTWNQDYSGYSSAASDKLNVNPMYVSATSNLHLQAGSPAINAGIALTTAVGAGSSSTSLTVADAGYFSDGYGIPNVAGDWIRIGGANGPTAQIASVNYSTNVLTLTSPVSWSTGASVYLYKDSNGNAQLNLANANPDMGAYQYSTGSSTPPAAPVPPVVSAPVVVP